jgi:predicted ArsR family transcriptional regulator
MTVRNLDALQSAMTKRERLLWLLRSRTQAEPVWTLAELADRLYCTERTVQRHFEWLRDYGYLPDHKHVARDDTYPVAAMPTLHP